jgi:hypothetical protein
MPVSAVKDNGENRLFDNLNDWQLVALGDWQLWKFMPQLKASASRVENEVHRR